MGTYLNHQPTFIFADDQTAWAKSLPENSAGWYSDENRGDSHDSWDGSTTSISHGKAHEDYLADYAPKISQCGRVVQFSTGMYGSYDLSTWSIPDTLIAIVSQWDNTQQSGCFFRKTVLAKDVEAFDWFPGAHRAEYIGEGLEKFRPDQESLGIDTSQWSQDLWDLWSARNDAAIMCQLPMDIPLPLELTQLSKVPDVESKEYTPLFKPGLIVKDECTEGRTFVLTGKLEGFTRAEATELLEAHGGTVVDSIRKGVDILLAGEKAGSKVKKAEELGIEVCDGQEWMDGLKDFKGN